jgi:CBS domain-containing protein
MNEKISAVLRSKGSDVYSVTPDATVDEAVHMMAARGIGAVLVVEHGTLRGIASAKDYGTRVLLQGKNSKEVSIREIMTRPVESIGPDATILDGMQVMTARKIRYLPVLENGVLLGVVTLSDLVRAILADNEHAMERFIRHVAQR